MVMLPLLRVQQLAVACATITLATVLQKKAVKDRSIAKGGYRALKKPPW